MQKGQNFNHPSKGSRIKVAPIRRIEDLDAIRKSLAGNPRNLALFTLGINTCLRPVDLLGIKIRQVLGLEDTGEINIRERRTGQDRRIPLNRECVETITALLRARTDQENGVPDPEGFLFTGRRGPLLLPSLNNLVKKWCADIDLAGNYGSHSLRKTFGYGLLVYSGVALTEIMDRFNHVSPYQTLEYLGIGPEEINQIRGAGAVDTKTAPGMVEEKLEKAETENARLRQQVEKLKEREEQLNIIIENAKDAIVLTDIEGYFLDATESCMEFSGFTRDELKGKHFSEVGFMSPETAQKCIDLIHEVLQGKPGRRMELEATRKDGTALVIEANPEIIKKDGKIVGCLAIMRDITKLKQAEEVLLRHRDHLEELVAERTANLEESNTALKVLLKKGDEVKKEIEDKILFNIKELVFPYLDKMKKSRLDDRQRTYMDIIESNLDNVISPFIHGISARYLKITPMEIQVANLIRQGKTSKEIAELLNMSSRTIDTHRYNIRKKIGLKNKKANLRTYLLSAH